jgi:hypothetical protein
MLVFSTPLVNYGAPLTFSLVDLPPPSLCEYVQGVCNRGGGGGGMGSSGGQNDDLYLRPISLPSTQQVDDLAFVFKER